MPTLPAFSAKTRINESPHVVILGAGASLATLPKGDVNGTKLPLMNNIVELVGLGNLLLENGIHYDNEDFEALFSDLVDSGNSQSLVSEIESKVHDYFSKIVLPEHPTIYDYLLLSLRKKDVVATFNWDPLLVQAHRRNRSVAELPRMVFLHGNVEIGVCKKHKIMGYYYQKCSKCKQKFTPSKLLYPVKNKDYQSDSYIQSEWDTLKSHLNFVYFFTVFGYSAPDTDAEAKSLMLNAWQENSTLELAEFEIIDIKNKDELHQSWEEFPFSHHYRIENSFYDSYLFNFPRRSCDAFAMQSLQCDPWEENIFPRFSTLEELHRWIQPLIDEEDAGSFSGEPCPNI